jgi:hypothetical protein
VAMDKEIIFSGNSKKVNNNVLDNNTMYAKILPVPLKNDLLYKYIINGITRFGYKGYIVWIKYKKNEALRISCLSEEVLNEFISFGNKIMNNHRIANYLMESDDYELLRPTSEWNNNPFKRQQELVTGNDLGYKCINLRLYNNTDLREYENKNEVEEDKGYTYTNRTKKMAA